MRRNFAWLLVLLGRTGGLSGRGLAAPLPGFQEWRSASGS